jgi:choline monooxygenase
MMRYPGRGNFIILNVIPVGPERTLETYDFFFEEAEPNADEMEVIRYLDETLQAEDISLVESVQKGMQTPAFTQGRFVTDPELSGQMEHGVHHFHGLLAEAYKRGVEAIS